MLTAKNVAEYFLVKTEPDYEEYISNLKLQKLLWAKLMFASHIKYMWQKRGAVIQLMRRTLVMKRWNVPDAVKLSFFDMETVDGLAEIEIRVHKKDSERAVEIIAVRFSEGEIPGFEEDDFEE